VINVTQPLADAAQYAVVLTGEAASTYHVRIETVQDTVLTDVEVFTQTLAAGETHGSVITLSAQDSALALSATAPAPVPQLSIPRALALSGFSGTEVSHDFTITENGGQESLQTGVITGTDLMNQLGGTIPAASLSIEPHSFDLLAGGSQTVVVRADLTGVEPGRYQGSLVIRSDSSAVRMVPLTVEVRFHHLCLPFVANQR
jgi:hypothetical protein